MAYYEDLEIDKDGWTDIHGGLSISSGTEIFVQNVGDRDVRIVTSATTPTQRAVDNNYGILVPKADKSDPFTQQVTITPGAGEEAYATSVGTGKGKVSVQD